MKGLLWVVGLFAAAVALTLAARYSPGYVLIVLPKYRVELSLNFALLLLAAVLILGYLALRTLSITINMPRRAAEFRTGQRSLRARRAFQQALAAYFEGRFGRAERAAREAMEDEETRPLALALAARAAHETRQHAARDSYLQRLEIDEPAQGDLYRMIRAEQLCEDRRFSEALDVLSQIQDKHPAALRLELKAHQQARNWDQVLTLLPLLEKRKILEPALLEQLKRYAQTEALKRRSLDAKGLHEYWERLNADDRHDTRIAAAAAESFIALGDCPHAHAIIEASLDAHWDSALLSLYVECLPKDARRHLERAEAWLKQHPGDPLLLLALGEICMHQALWGKARSYLEASIAIDESHSAYVQLGRLLEQLGKPEDASQAYRKGLDLTLGQLKQSTGGRRRVAL